MCVHHIIFGDLLETVITVDVRLRDDGGFDILIIAMRDIPAPSVKVIADWRAIYMSDKFSFRRAGLKSVMYISNKERIAQNKLCDHIDDYTLSPYGVCELMTLKTVDQMIFTDKIKIQDGKFPGNMVSAPLVNGKPDMSKATVQSRLSPRIQKFQKQILAKYDKK